MKTIYKISLIALMSITCSVLSARTVVVQSSDRYKCPGKPDVIYENRTAAQKECGNKAYPISYARHHYRQYPRHHRYHDRYYQRYNDDGYYDDDGNYHYYDNHGVVGDAAEGAHDVASNVWHGIFG